MSNMVGLEIARAMEAGVQGVDTDFEARVEEEALELLDACSILLGVVDPGEPQRGTYPERIKILAALLGALIENNRLLIDLGDPEIAIRTTDVWIHRRLPAT